MEPSPENTASANGLSLMADRPAYVELQVTTHFSFLRGASSPDELFAAAALLGLPALGIVDRHSVAGIVRAWDAEKATGVRAIVGMRLDLTDGTALLLYPTDRAAYGRMCRLAKHRQERAPARGVSSRSGPMSRQWNEGLLASFFRIAPTPQPKRRSRGRSAIFGDARLYGAHDPPPSARCGAAARPCGDRGQARACRRVATNDILYHAPERRMLQDVVTCIREKCTIDALGDRRERFADRYLKTGGRDGAAL